jgi:hypothetical protein
MITTNVINILYRAGAKQQVVCLNKDEAANVWVQIREAMAVGQPLLSIEDDSTATVIAVLEIASCTLSDIEPLRIEQAPQRERPRPQPVPARVERGALIAN